MGLPVSRSHPAMSQASLRALYPEHLAVLQARAAEALRRGGQEHLLIPSGTLHYQAEARYPCARA